MQIDHLKGSYLWLGGERLARAIYEHMSSSLTPLEQYALLLYLALPIHAEAMIAFRSADESARKAARVSVMQKFPKEWPPPEATVQKGATVQ